MSRRRRLAGLAGVALVLLGTAGPWAFAHTWAGPVATARSLDHGAVGTLLLSLLAGVLLLGRLRAAAAVAALLGLLWTAYALYVLPGALTENGAWEAHLAWGAGVTFLGAIILAAAAVAPAA